MLPNLLPQSSHASKFALATLLLGSNDAASEKSMQHVPLSEYKENLIFIVNYLKTINPAMVIILITPPPNNPYEINPAWDLRVDVKKYERAVVEVAARMQVELLTLWEGPFAIDPKTELLHDGLHFDVASNRKVADGIKHIVTNKHPSLLPEKSFSYPDFGELTRHDPKTIVDLLASWTTTEK